VIGQPPPFALATPVFRFKALASHAGRAALGGDREVALACFTAARLTAGLLPPFMLAPADSAARIASTRQWLASITLSHNARVAMVAVIDAVAAGNRRSAVAALSGLIEACVRQLDQASVAELHELMGELA
jgi:hypothetical protein